MNWSMRPDGKPVRRRRCNWAAARRRLAVVSALAGMMLATLATLHVVAAPPTPSAAPAAKPINVGAAKPPAANPATAPAASKPAATTAGSADAQAQLDLYVKPDGTGYFALALPAQKDLPNTAGHDIAILFDTSASQIGEPRERALKALGVLVGQCETADRISLSAVDLATVPLTTSFVEPSSTEMAAAIKRLERRVPLGATDLPAALAKAASSFPPTSANSKAIVYIGDGVSAAQLFVPAEFAKLTDALTQAHVAVFSYGLGPRVDGPLLAALANYTGGTIVLDDESIDPKAAGVFLAAGARGPVAWIESTEWPKAFEQVFPRHLTPLRADRETVTIGKGNLSGTLEIAVDGSAASEPWHRRWSATAGASNNDFAFVPVLFALAEKDNGATLATLGTKGLRQIGLVLMSTTDELVKLARQMLGESNFDDAERLTDEVLRRDPQDPTAGALKREIAKLRAEDQAKAKAEAAKKPAGKSSGKSGGKKTTDGKSTNKLSPPQKSTPKPSAQDSAP